jgi:hypothetical protein
LKIGLAANIWVVVGVAAYPQSPDFGRYVASYNDHFDVKVVK